MEFEMQLLKKDYESKCRELESAVSGPFYSWFFIRKS